MKIVLVCTGDPESVYWSMSSVVASAARKIMPECDVTIVTDGRSDATRSALLRNVHVVNVAVPPADAVVASRWLKVRLRFLISGDFLFLDSDALPVGAFAQHLDCVRSFAAVPDATGLQPPGRFPQWALELYRRLGWRVPRRPYVNSGVMFWRDEPPAYDLARRWQSSWDSTMVLGESRDQPSLNHAIDESGIQIQILDRSLNTMVEVERHRLREAKIWHFFASIPGRPITVLDELAAASERGEALDWSVLQEAVESGHAWPGMTKRAIREEIARRALGSAWSQLHDHRPRMALWSALQAIRNAPWRRDSYAMLVRAAVKTAVST